MAPKPHLKYYRCCQACGYSHKLEALSLLSQQSFVYSDSSHLTSRMSTNHICKGLGNAGNRSFSFVSMRTGNLRIDFAFGNSWKSQTFQTCRYYKDAQLPTKKHKQTCQDDRHSLRATQAERGACANICILRVCNIKFIVYHADDEILSV